MTACNPNDESSFCCCVIPSDLKETAVAKTAVLTELDRHGYTDEAKFGVKLALEEALTNAIKHGNRGDVSKTVTVRYAVSPEKIVVIVRDEGVGFAPDLVPDCTCPERLPVPNGRGILLIKAYTDEVCYRDNGREIYFMRKRLSPTAKGCGCPSPVRRTLHFSGGVQNVGFRCTTQTLASRFKVTGFVRNLPDGRVELVAEGAEVELDRFEAAVAQAMQSHIRDTQSADAPATGQYKNFAIAP